MKDTEATTPRGEPEVLVSASEAAHRPPLPTNGAAERRKRSGKPRAKGPKAAQARADALRLAGGPKVARERVLGRVLTLHENAHAALSRDGLTREDGEPRALLQRFESLTTLAYTGLDRLDNERIGPRLEGNGYEPAIEDVAEAEAALLARLNGSAKA